MRAKIIDARGARMEAKTPIKTLVLTELAGGETLFATEIALRILAKHPGTNKSSVMTQMSNYAKQGIVEANGGNGYQGYRITEAGRKLLSK